MEKKKKGNKKKGNTCSSLDGEELPPDKKKGKEFLQETLLPLGDAVHPTVWSRSS
jgi:hypothetical protein